MLKLNILKDIYKNNFIFELNVTINLYLVKKGFLLFILFTSYAVNAQLGRGERYESYFGFQVKPLLPTKFIGSDQTVFSNQGYNVEIKQKIGYSFGGVVRVAITDFIGIETGINYNQRYYQFNMSIPDSNISQVDNFGFIQYDIPLNALFYVKMTKKWFMNAALGPAIGYKPSSVGTIASPLGKHEFINIGLVGINKKLNIDLTGNVGFEYRTKKSGIFYLGGSARVPTSPLFELVSRYRNGNYEVDNYGKVGGSFLSIDLKYFIPNTGGNGQKFNHGPIE